MSATSHMIDHRSATHFLEDPSRFFSHSFTAMHEVDPSKLRSLQRAALALRFQELRPRIATLDKLAARQSINALHDFDDVLPLLFEHTIYKSYPVKLLESRRFDLLTKWLAKLTPADLSGVDTEGCATIDGWLDRIAADARVDVTHTSGTTGTMSFFPWSAEDLAKKFFSRRVSELQKFGSDPTRAQLEDPVHLVSTANRFRLGNPLADALTSGQEGLLHIRRPARPSADLLWLAARMRLAAAKGDLTRVKVPEFLLARRDELEREQRANEDSDARWLAEIESLQGQRVLWSIFVHDIVEIAEPRVAAGERWAFADGSMMTMAGGTKGKLLPADWRDTVSAFVSMPITKAYGMTEMSCFNLECGNGRYHLMPWIIPFVLDPQTSRALPRTGRQRGRFAFFDLLPTSHWGGIITGDDVEVDFDSECGCGRRSAHVGPEISRFSDQRGGDDKITCAATPAAHAEAMQHLVGL